MSTLIVLHLAAKLAVRSVMERLAVYHCSYKPGIFLSSNHTHLQRARAFAVHDASFSVLQNTERANSNKLP